MRKGGATSYQEGRKISSEEGRTRKVVREGGRYVCKYSSKEGSSTSCQD